MAKESLISPILYWNGIVIQIRIIQKIYERSKPYIFLENISFPVLFLVAATNNKFFDISGQINQKISKLRFHLINCMNFLNDYIQRRVNLNSKNHGVMLIKYNRTKVSYLIKGMKNVLCFSQLL